MPSVKGSKQVRMIVVPHQPGRDMAVRVAIGIALLACCAAAYWFGFSRGVFQNGDARAERDYLQESVEQLSAENAQVNQRLLNLEQEGQVDKAALAGVQATILSLREKNSQLEEDVLFYKRILSPENEEMGLAVGQLDLIRTDQPGKIRYKLELRQQGNNETMLSGYVNINVLGIQDDQEVSVPLRSLSETEKSLDIRLQFRYFQNIEGELQLPDNFEPQKVQILAVAEGDSGKTVRKSFGWVVQD